MIELWTIGKPKFTFINEGEQEFVRRIRHYSKFSFESIEVKLSSRKNMSSSDVKLAESEAILKRLGDKKTLILLDERGKRYNSISFAKKLEHWQVNARDGIVFLVGGAYGFDELLYARAQDKVSLSDMTFSHQLIRLIFLEQLYRAHTILRGEKSHNP